MSFVINMLLFFVAGALLIASAVLSSEGAAKIQKLGKGGNDDYLKKAHKWASWATFTAWLSVAIIITFIVLYLIFGIESVEFTGGIVMKLFLLTTLAAMIATGSLAAISLSNINKSASRLESRSDGTYQKMVWAMILSLVGAVIIIVLFIFMMTHKKKRGGAVLTKEEKESEKEITDLKKRLLAEKESELEAKKEQNILNAAQAHQQLTQIN